MSSSHNDIILRGRRIKEDASGYICLNDLHELAAGVAPDRIIFAGVGKSRSEMAFALSEGVVHFNVESEPELDALSEVAASLGQTARIAFRVNPDVDPGTHKKISTGNSETKFGIPYGEAGRLYGKAATLPGIVVAGIHMHIGSQITALEPFARAFALMRDLVVDLRAAGHDIRHVDLGGGLGVPYRSGNEVPPHPDEYAGVVRSAFADLDVQVMLEPGRMIVANAGILVVQVLYVKQGDGRTFTIVDGAMNDLIRPTLYDAHHEIWPVLEARRNAATVVSDVVGPVCETGDYLALERAMPKAEPGDLLAVMTAGAYGAVQSGTYNTRLLVPEVLVRGRDYSIVRPRQTYAELLGLDRMAAWQTPDEPGDKPRRAPGGRSNARRVRKV